MLSRPVIVVNFKVYSEAEGTNALDLARICAAVSEESGISIAVCPPMTELGYVSRNVSIPVLSQNADPRSPGSSTGWVTPQMIKASGAVGTLINHSEHGMGLNDVDSVVRICKDVGIKTIVCADSSVTAGKIASFGPDIIAVEPPELIGGDVSVTSADPGVVRDTVNSVKSINNKISVLCGAGVKTGEDVRNAVDLGADGVLLASGVVKSKDPRASLLDLIRYL